MVGSDRHAGNLPDFGRFLRVVTDLEDLDVADDKSKRGSPTRDRIDVNDPARCATGRSL